MGVDVYIQSGFFFFFFLSFNSSAEGRRLGRKDGEGLTLSTITILQNTTLIQPHETWRLVVAV